MRDRPAFGISVAKISWLETRSFRYEALYRHLTKEFPAAMDSFPNARKAAAYASRHD